MHAEAADAEGEDQGKLGGVSEDLGREDDEGDEPDWTRRTAPQST